MTHTPAPTDDGLPIAPALASWQAMSSAERASWLEGALAALERHEQETIFEGPAHERAVFGISASLRELFPRVGRAMYVSSLPVFYPGERVLAPDIVVVPDVIDPGLADARVAWVVAEEGRGPGLALEVVHSGDRQRDLVDNVCTFARLGIPEYFVVDRREGRLHGYRLPSADSRVYEPIPRVGKTLRSQVLGLELGLSDSNLRFYHRGERVLTPQEQVDQRLTRLRDLLHEADPESRAELEHQVDGLLTLRGLI